MSRLSLIWRAAIEAAPVRLWALIAAGPVLTLLAIGFALIVWLGPCPASPLAEQRLRYLGLALLITLALLGIVVSALAAVRVSGKGPGGTGFEIDGNATPAAQPSRATVTATVETPSAVVAPAKAEGETE